MPMVWALHRGGGDTKFSAPVVDLFGRGEGASDRLTEPETASP